MLFVIIGIDRDKYAIPACDIIEIAPSTPSKNVTRTSRSVAGLVEYRGHGYRCWTWVSFVAV